MHALLRHLEQRGFRQSPRVLGIDEDSREVLTFIPGRVATTRPWPAEVWTEATLDQIGRIIRQYHEAVRSFAVPADAVWQFHNRGCLPGELICHNDVGVTNVVFGDSSKVTGLIDWDNAGPGHPIDEVAHAAWWFVPLVDPSLRARIGAPSEERERARLAVLADAYGGIDTGLLAARVSGVVASRLRAAQKGIEAGHPAFLALDARGYSTDLRNTLAYLHDRAAS